MSVRKQRNSFLRVLSVKAISGRLSHNQMEGRSNFLKAQVSFLVATLVASVTASTSEEAAKTFLLVSKPYLVCWRKSKTWIGFLI